MPKWKRNKLIFHVNLINTSVVFEKTVVYSPPSTFFSLSHCSFVPIVRVVRNDKTTAARDEKGVCHTSIGVRIDTFAECETEVAFGATY